MANYLRLLKQSSQSKSSFFLFGPRGTGKTSWLKENFKNATYIDLLEDEIFNQLLANPGKLLNYIPENKKNEFVIIDEIQKVPKLLDEVHRLIELKNLKFILTGSNARKLKRVGVNLLAGRALTYEMYPLTATELKKDFDLKRALQYGTLPLSITGDEPKKFLQSYVRTYLKEEIQGEGLTRNLEAFARFLQTASFSQGAPLVISNIASEAGINRKVVEDYFSILRDLLLSVELPIFTKRSKRELITKRKFYYFDAGVYRSLRPVGPLDSDAEINSFALETLVLNEIRVLNDQMEMGYELFYWHTKDHLEVDFVIYGAKGFRAFEVKSAATIQSKDLQGLREFKKDYPQAKLYLLYGGSEEKVMESTIHLVPVTKFFKNPISYLVCQ